MKARPVGSTQDSQGRWSHAFIWEDDVMTDLNTLFPTSSNLFAVMANKINERGQISGMAIALSDPDAGNIRAFLATPAHQSGQVGCRGRAYTPRNPIYPRMLATIIRRDSDSPTSSDKSYFRSIRTMHSGHMPLCNATSVRARLASMAP
jgi:probable HAF family extracellular repeat protein